MTEHREKYRAATGTPNGQNISPRKSVGRAVCGCPSESDKATPSPKPYGYELWQHILDEHGLMLMPNEIDEIIQIAKRVLDQDKKNPAL